MTTTRRRLPLLLLVLAACSDDGAATDTSADTTTDATVADTTTDATVAETTTDTSGGTGDDTSPDTTAPDTTAPDTIADTTTPDTITDVTAPGDGDTSSGDLTIAVPGARCALDERVGVVEISAPVFGPNGYVSAWIQDRPDPWYGAPELTTDQCVFHRMSTVACPECDPDEVCDRAGTCVDAPLRRTDATLTLAAGATTQAFTADPTTGDIYGDITLAGDTLAAELTFGGHRVTLAATTFPAPLTNLAGTITGGYEAPTAVDITWSPSASDGTVFTHIPINHHAAGPTFTECAVPASSGAMQVGEAMLTPLAIITGLEFQGVHHLRFAAAETPLGCVELRFTSGQQYVNLERPR